MKKFVAMVMVIIAVIMTTSAYAFTRVNWDYTVTGFEVTDGLKDFVKEGVDIIVYIQADHECEDGTLTEVNAIRFIDDEWYNYNETYGVMYDKYGNMKYEGHGSVYLDINFERKDIYVVVNGLLDYLEEQTDYKFEIWVCDVEEQTKELLAE